MTDQVANNISPSARFQILLSGSPNDPNGQHLRTLQRGGAYELSQYPVARCYNRAGGTFIKSTLG